jgi:ribonuclease HI
MATLQLYCDGGSRSNPGPSGLGVAGYHVGLDGNRGCIFEKGVYLENCSNNFAEYLALIQALNYAMEADYRIVELYSDSKLIVEQVNGRWKVKSSDLVELAQSAIGRVEKMRKHGRSISLTWIPREKNIHADSLANLAMDRKGTAEYRRDFNQADKMARHMEAMLAHEELVKSLAHKINKAKIRRLKESFDRVIDTWAYLKI